MRRPPLPQEVVQHRTLAESAFNGKDLPGAIAQYRQGLAIDATWPEGWFNLALLCGEVNDFACAVDGLKRYLELRPDAPDAAATRGQLEIWEAKVRPH